MTIREFELVGVLTMIAALWNQLVALTAWPRKLLVIGREVDHDAAGSIASYLGAVARYRPGDMAFYRADRVHVKPLGRPCLVFSEGLIFGPKVFWLRGRPVWMRHSKGEGGNGPSSYVYSLRWTFNWENFLRDVATWADEREHPKTASIHRFTVTVHGGESASMGDRHERRPPLGSVAVAPSAPGVADDLGRIQGGYRLLHWSVDDLTPATPVSIETMSLRPEIEALVSDVDHFVASREWYEEHGIYWRRGWMLHGKPGTGKTSIVRGMAIKHDLPVHVFDLGSMDNYTLRSSWQAMLSDAPCVALIEDIDGVYHGRDYRKNEKGQQIGEGPTFDCLLNCIGGISACDGVLLFVTTNLPDMVDPALRRGGRVDMEVEFVGMDHAGRVKMARRILDDQIEADRIALDPAYTSMSPADLQERLCRIAVARRFGDAA